MKLKSGRCAAKSANSGISSSNVLSTISTRRTPRARLFVPVESVKSAPKKMCNACMTLQANTFITPCNHRYCKACLGGMYRAALSDRELIPVRCCNMQVDSMWSGQVLKKAEAIAYANALEEKMADNVMYCPSKTCSAFIILNASDAPRISANRRLRCPGCRTWLCADCRTAHPNMDCEAFQALPKDQKGFEDHQFLQLAKRKSYQRCEHCHRYIERNGGCTHMTCRCGHSFTFSRKQ